jgi:hypothetical protein
MYIINVYNITGILPELSSGPDIHIQIVMKYVLQRMSTDYNSIFIFKMSET